jgi:hypothetical protein
MWCAVCDLKPSRIKRLCPNLGFWTKWNYTYTTHYDMVLPTSYILIEIEMFHITFCSWVERVLRNTTLEQKFHHGFEGGNWYLLAFNPTSLRSVALVRLDRSVRWCCYKILSRKLIWSLCYSSASNHLSYWRRLVVWQCDRPYCIT